MPARLQNGWRGRENNIFPKRPKTNVMLLLLCFWFCLFLHFLLKNANQTLFNKQNAKKSRFPP